MTRAAIAALLSACGPAPGTQPHDMSTSGHEAAARSEETQATQHDSDYVAGQSGRCVPGGSPRARLETGVCWTSDINPTEPHRQEAERHRALAAAHRTASQALRDAEERVCGGIAESDRDTSPFEHREDIVRVERLTERRTMGRTEIEYAVGARLVIRAVPWMTAEWLQRVVDCHVARNAALGHEVPEMPTCPLVPAGVTRRAQAIGIGFAIDVRGDTDAVRDEIWRRAQLLTQPSAR